VPERRVHEAGQVSAALGGLSVLDVSNTLTGTQITQLLADFGADVIHVEPPGGSVLRTQPAWPFWGRGKRSIVLDLKDPDDAAVARSIAARSDVLVETWRPGVAERLGLGFAELATVNPGLVYASVTGFGRENRWSAMRGYEPVVMAKIGGLDAFSSLSPREGPSFVSSPYCSFSAAQLAVQGILAALVERESSGLGDRVETTLVQGILAHDTWNWLIRTIVARYPDAFAAAPPADPDALVPNSPLFFRLMVGLSADGRWLQFSQTTERLWQAYLRAAGLEWTKEDPVLKNGPSDEDPKVRVAFWETALNAVREKTYEEWTKAFEEEPDVWAEIFRNGTELLHHPQMVHNGATVVIDDPSVGPVLQPGPLVQMSATPAELGRPARSIDQDGDAIRAAQDSKAASSAAVPGRPAASGSKPAPLAGVTVIELGTFYAAPFGATILADLGARVIKIEQLDGDPMRHIIPFPEAGGAKVLQGKESVAVDMASEAGRRIVLELVRRADIVLQTFRAGVAERHGYTAADLLAVNPDLVYLNAPGYGVDGPCGHRPAFAPTIGAGSGLAYRNVGGPNNVPRGPELTLEEVKRNSIRLSAAAMGVGHADGFSALGVASALLVGLLAKKRGAPGQSMMTSMLSTMAHTLSEDMVEYDNRPPLPTPGVELYGLGARYRLYRASDGWVFLAAPSDKEWRACARALELSDTLDEAELAAVLEERFATRSAVEWERELAAHDVTCAAVVAGPIEEVVMLGGGMGKELGIVTETSNPVLGDYLRLLPLVRYERLGGVAGPAPLCGAQTDAVLAELGYDAEAIDRLREEHVLG
jgi:crotonobetainyl-CoA:carnitine CoA-transferase CaiB-like acyl-CoA transferase